MSYKCCLSDDLAPCWAIVVHARNSELKKMVDFLVGLFLLGKLESFPIISPFRRAYTSVSTSFLRRKRCFQCFSDHGILYQVGGQRIPKYHSVALIFLIFEFSFSFWRSSSVVEVFTCLTALMPYLRLPPHSFSAGDIKQVK